MEKSEILNYINSNKIERGDKLKLIKFNDIVVSGTFHGFTKEYCKERNMQIEEVLFVHLETNYEKYKSLPHLMIKSIVNAN